MNEKQLKEMSPDQIVSEFGTKSSAIRYMSNELKMKRGTIAKLLDIRYQHVRNVLITPLKRDQNK